MPLQAFPPWLLLCLAHTLLAPTTPHMHPHMCSRDKTVWLWEAQPGNEYEVVDVKHGHSQVSPATVCWESRYGGLLGLQQQPGMSPSAATCFHIPPLLHPLPSLPPCLTAPSPCPALFLRQDVKCVRWHPQGEVLASASYDDSIKLWVDEDDEWVCAQTLAGAQERREGALGCSRLSCPSAGQGGCGCAGDSAVAGRSTPQHVEVAHSCY